jgi:hypothetical protein
VGGIWARGSRVRIRGWVGGLGRARDRGRCRVGGRVRVAPGGIWA